MSFDVFTSILCDGHIVQRIIVINVCNKINAVLNIKSEIKGGLDNKESLS